MFSSSQSLSALQPIQIQQIEHSPSVIDSKQPSSPPLQSSNLIRLPTPPSPQSSQQRRRRNLRRRRSQIVRNSIQGTLHFLPANFFPNLPRPPAQPGLMPTRGGGKKAIESKRLKAAEHCKAKTVFFYKDGDEYFTGVRVPISKSRFRTMDALMDSLNESIPLPFGVRRLHTPTGKTAIRSLDDLQPQGRYIAASTIRRVRGVDMEAVERRKRLRDDAQRRWNFQQSSANTDASHRRLSQSAAGQSFESSTKSDDRLQQSSSGAIGRQQQIGATGGRSRSRQGMVTEFEMTMTSVDGRAHNPFMPVTSKQIFFVLNGHPHRVYRALVNPLRRGQLEPLLEEVSEGLQAAIFRIYSFEGDRILNMEQLLQLKDMRAIAVPRHERLMLNGMTQSDILRIPPMRQLSNSNQTSSSLPPIGKASSSKNSSSKSSSGGSQSRVRQPNNNIDRLPAYDEPMGGGGNRFGGGLNESNRRKRSRSPLPPSSNEEHLPKAAFLNGNGGMVNSNSSGNGGRQRANSTSLPQQQNGIAKTPIPAANEAPTAASTSNTTADSDSGRPRSTMEMELIGQDGDEEGDEPIYEEEEKEVENLLGKKKEEEENDEREEEEDDDYPEEPPELKAMHTPRRKKKKKKGGNKEEEVIDEEEEEEKEELEKKNDEEENEALKEEDRELLRQVFREDEVDEQPNNKEKEANKPRGSMQIEVIHRDEHGQIISGEYSDELERILYGQAAVKIQSAWRGYAVRKELKRTRFAEHPTYINGDGLSSRRGGGKNVAQNSNALYKPNERHQAIVSRVKTPMPGQKGPNSVLKKKSLMLDPDYGTETMIDSSSDREEANVTELLQAKKSLGWEMATPEKSPSLSRRSPKNDYVYTITVITGNRWAADTEADLYIILHGADKNSEKLWLRQEFTNWLQSGPSGQRFRQNQSDSFQFPLPQRIGIIKKITVGHECRGYGAGCFIDRILVTEDEEAAEENADSEEGADCRQFMFLCNKWFDSGQVDGKLERTIRLSAFYEIGSIPIENRVTRGRWEFILHSGTERGQGGTTSQLAITGYGTRGQSCTANLYDSAMAKVPSESLIQVDFGDIGELLKVRIEVDGYGDEPDYFLNYVEFKDLDTEERFVVMCGKWLRWLGTKKGDQPFRELFAFHIGVEPLPLISYDGKIRVLSPRIECLGSKEVQLELYGDLGETGFFRVDVSSSAGLAIKNEQTNEEDEENNNDNGNGGADKIDIAFKVEAVSVGRVIGAKVRFEPNQIGQEIMEGLLAVQGIFQKQGIWPLQSNSEFLIGRILLRESLHTPYRYVLTRSQFQEMSAQICTKEMSTTEMEGISTRRPKRKQGPKAKPNWLLQMSLGIGSFLLPEVILCGENGQVRLLPLDSTPSDWMLSYQPEDSLLDIGALRKIRIMTDGQKFLTSLDLEDGEKGDNAEEIPPFALVQKMRICDTANGDELRFPSADCHLQRHSVYEMSTIWPDRPPIPIVIYLIRIVIGDANFPTQTSPTTMPALTVRLNFSGEFGDVGWRTLSSEEMEFEENGAGGAATGEEQQHSPQIALFAPKTRNSFEFEAVSIGELHWAELEVRSEQQNFTWECKELVVTDTNTALFYTFQFERQFSTDFPIQRCATLPFTNAL